MAAAAFVVSQTGPLVTIQDGGRPRMMRYGLPTSGPMDRVAFAVANAALGNPAGSPAIEISMGGVILECVEGSVTFAVAGGGFQVAVDQVSLGRWCVATIRAGSRIVVKPGAWGSWAYLTFAGELRAKSWLGSVSTHSLSGFGGGSVAASQRLVVENAEIREDRIGEIPCPEFAWPCKSPRIVLGPQDRFFASGTIGTLLSSAFTLTGAYDRMGVRLAGPLLHPNATLDMPSEAIVRGAVQVAGDGVPTVLLADHGTTGGYPKIATVVSCDLDGFVQLRSRDKVTFTSVAPASAIEAARTRHHALESFLDSLQSRTASLAQRLLSMNLIDGVISASD